MLKNYFTIALRHILKHKLSSLINILCLSIGITFSVIIGVYILNQERVNKGIRDVANQYIIKSRWKVKEMGLDLTTIGPLAKTMKEEYPNLVANYFRFNPVGGVLSVGNNHFKENVSICDTTLETMYGFPILYGDKDKVFATIKSAVITESVAQKLFGTKNAVGRSFEMSLTKNGLSQSYQVSAVLMDIPKNSVTEIAGNEYHVFVPTIGNNFYGGGDPSEGWNTIFEAGRLELKDGVTPEQMELPFRQVLAKYADKNTRDNLQVELAPVKDYFLKENGAALQKMITALSLIATFILLMAIINFVNINIGTSTYRLKEIGLRKVFGGLKRQLVVQFIGESLLLTIIAAFLSVVLYELFRGLFSGVLNSNLVSVVQFGTGKISLFSGFVLLVGLISGLYPAFVLGRSDTVHAVKGKAQTGTGGLVLRKVLLVVQFSLATIVFISALNVSRQMSYIFSRDLGYKKEALLIVEAYPKRWDSAGIRRMEHVRDRLEQMPELQEASLSFEIPTRSPPGQITLFPVWDKKNIPLVLAAFAADQNYAKTFGLKMLAGQFFSQGGGFIPNQCVLNESAAKALGFGSATEAVGRILKQPAGNPDLTIAGVVGDYNYSNLQERIEPLVIIHIEDMQAYRYMSMKLSSDNLSAAVEAVKAKWKLLLPEAPFEYQFMDDQFQALYRPELQLKIATGIATVLNLMIVFLGIFGVVAFTLAKRNKEIAVRKVLGANIKNIFYLLVREYLGLILLSNLIAWPLAYIMSGKWLENYAYRTSQALWFYPAVCGFIVITTILLILAQSFKSAVVSPVKSLRIE